MELITETGRTIDEAEPGELIIGPDGSAFLGVIDEEAATVAGIEAGGICANVGAVRHTERGHINEITSSGYSGAAEFIYDVVHNYERIYDGTDGSILLTKYLGHHHAIAAIELSQDEAGVYRTKTAWTLREKKLSKKKLLYVRSEP